MDARSDHLTDRPNLPDGCVDVPQDLDALSAVELAEALEYALATTAEDDFNEELIDAYLDALDHKAPMPELPDTEVAYADFQKRLQTLTGKVAPTPVKQSAGARRARRVGLVAAIVIVCMLGGLFTAQAAGFDVIGTFARWTENVFSFGAMRTGGAEDIIEEPDKETLPMQGLEYASLQEALDANGITEVTEPAWFPEGYTLEELFVTDDLEADYFMLRAGYVHDGDTFAIVMMRYAGGPAIQAENGSTSVESREMGGITFYLIENSDNYTVAWVTEHYECYMFGSYDMGTDVLWKMVESMFN